MSDKLDALRAALVAATKETVSFLDDIPEPFWPILDSFRLDLMGNANFGSLDAAMALHKAVLPGWELNQIGEAKNKLGPWFCVLVNPHYWTGLQGADVARSTTPARAWLIAIITALIAIEEGKA